MEQFSPQQARICTVCGSAVIKPSIRQNVTLSDDTRDLVYSILSYRCENGHVSIAAGLHS
jgi:hypothetical protein